MLTRPAKIEVENAQLLGGGFKNFSGKGSQYNREGDRFCHIRIDEDKVDELREAGWNIKERPGRDADDSILYYMKVNIRYAGPNDKIKRNPKIYKGTADGKMHLLTEENVGSLDRDEIEKVDIVINPSVWSRPDNSEGISAYLEEMYVTIKGSRFAGKYNIDDDSRYEEEEYFDE